jgi:hypothetical protein
MRDGLTRSESDFMTLCVSESNRRDADAGYRMCVVQCPIPLFPSCPNKGPISKMVV